MKILLLHCTVQCKFTFQVQCKHIKVQKIKENIQASLQFFFLNS